MSFTITDIDAKVQSILDVYADLKLAIQIEDIARDQGVKIMPYALGEEASGMLVIEGNQAIICYNQQESRVRRRFTVAHEFGHYMLHRNKSNLFVDKLFRAAPGKSPSINNKNFFLEKEANAFAASILMPVDLIKKELENMQIDLGSEDEIRALAKLFDVSTTAMHFRLMNLGHFS